MTQRLPSYKSADEYYKGVTVWEASLWAVKADESVTVKTRVNCFAHCKVATDLAALSVIPEPTTTDQVLQDFSVVFDDEEDPFEMDEWSAMPDLNWILIFSNVFCFSDFPARSSFRMSIKKRSDDITGLSILDRSQPVNLWRQK